MYWLFIINIVLTRQEYLAARAWKTEERAISLVHCLPQGNFSEVAARTKLHHSVTCNQKCICSAGWV